MMNIEKLQILLSHKRRLEDDIRRWTNLLETIDTVKEISVQYPSMTVYISKNKPYLCNGITDGIVLESMKRTFALELKGKISETMGKCSRVSKIIKDAEAALMTVEDPDDAEKAS
jgi:hypothetical protein